ncbi:MAG: hypothetical protein A3F54_00045 [Candidatus Kerfeldbacteria bacterium RIFCSPHIGHO2_12_FULL_48_17]|uniref:TIGR00725 family protein n=1 Tax=Candidatus Kerfeldbacteria bacterium RIFCSPHIGHO2_12_FULL_48_17 TaxID=1798542 RepID=A0A1G2B8B3_9BACT|nr:MAG: hypothetical protein A3F54_00045 [Candidatus Kerfeldbacteria bacterium RIFCSPHIGHO2_12_FULL_48_17]
MERKKIVAVVGPGRTATEEQCKLAYDIGFMIAENNWVLVNGGVRHGVMQSSSHGAHDCKGEIIGILPYRLPSETHQPSGYLTICIQTNLAEARNTIIAQTCDVMIAIGMCPGTASEVAFAIKEGKPVILLGHDVKSLEFFRDVLKGSVYCPENIGLAESYIKLSFRA